MSHHGQKTKEKCKIKTLKFVKRKKYVINVKGKQPLCVHNGINRFMVLILSNSKNKIRNKKEKSIVTTLKI